MQTNICLRSEPYEKNTSMANLITSVRILCALILVAAPIFSPVFYVFYLLGGVSDLLDGFVARRLGKETKFGARLDTAADILFFVIALIKFLPAVKIPMFLLVWVVCIALVKFANLACGFAIHRRLVSEHTVMNKICGGLLFAIPLCVGILPRPATDALIFLTCCCATAAAIREGRLIRAGKETT